MYIFINALLTYIQS